MVDIYEQNLELYLLFDFLIAIVANSSCPYRELATLLVLITRYLGKTRLLYLRAPAIGHQTLDIRFSQFPGIENNNDDFKTKLR